MRRIGAYNCGIYCQIEDEIKEILNELKSFEEYEVQRETEEWIKMTFTGSDNEDSTWVLLDDGERVPQQYSNLHIFLVKRGFGMTHSMLGTPIYDKLTDHFSDWSCKILCDTQDKRMELVKDPKFLNKGYMITELTRQRVQVDFINVEGPETKPQGYKFLRKVLRKHGFKPSSSRPNPTEFIQSGSSWTEKLLCVIL